MVAVFFKEVIFQCITFKTNYITECYILHLHNEHTFCKARDKLFIVCLYLNPVFLYSIFICCLVLLLILSVIVILFVHIRHICMHVLTVLRCIKHYFHVYIFSSYFFTNLHVLALLLFSNTVQVLKGTRNDIFYSRTALSILKKLFIAIQIIF